MRYPRKATGLILVLMTGVVGHAQAQSNVEIRMTADDKAAEKRLPMGLIHMGDNILIYRGWDNGVGGGLGRETAEEFALYDRESLALKRTAAPMLQHEGRELKLDGIVHFGGKPMIIAT